MSGADLMEKRIREYIEVKSGFGDPVVQERMLQREFRLFDADGSGEIDMTEFIKVLETLNCRGSDDDVDELFDRYDADCGGTITYKEVRKVARSEHVRADEKARLRDIDVRLQERYGTFLAQCCCF